MSTGSEWFFNGQRNMQRLLDDEVNLKDPTIGLPFGRLLEGVRFTALSCLGSEAPLSNNYFLTWLIDTDCES